MPQRVAVVGAGPAGFYACEDLLKAGFEVDLYDVLPTPFGLVRAGVAPDHPKIKSVTRIYEKTAARRDFGSSAASSSDETCTARTCSNGTTRSSTRSARPPTGDWEYQARTYRDRSPQPRSSAGTTAIPTSATTSSTSTASGWSSWATATWRSTAHGCSR